LGDLCCLLILSCFINMISFLQLHYNFMPFPVKNASYRPMNVGIYALF
jgi:hypothetical protein